MVPCDKILKTAIEEGADMIGLSGLITPSLDEMVSVAVEMERREMKMPLLIGGATTSRQHTAVKIAPKYGPEAIHVIDASRVVGAVGRLLDDGKRRIFAEENREAQAKLRALHEQKLKQPLMPYQAAVARRVEVDWRAAPAVPNFLGRQVIADFPLEDIVQASDDSQEPFEVRPTIHLRAGERRCAKASDARRITWCFRHAASLQH